LIEAAATGRPVVATDVGGVADIVADGATGFVVARGDVSGLAERICRLAGDPDLRRRLGAAAPSAAVRFDADRLVADLDRVYREALAARASSR
jgi:glycosyltransferase involved in cell wall biosynthesis